MVSNVIFVATHSNGSAVATALRRHVGVSGPGRYAITVVTRNKISCFFCPPHPNGLRIRLARRFHKT
jgi:hypothetical protein